MDKKQIFSIWYVLLALLALLILQDLLDRSHTETLSYSEFKQALAAGKVGEVVLKEGWPALV